MNVRIIESSYLIVFSIIFHEFLIAESRIGVVGKVPVFTDEWNAYKEQYKLKFGDLVDDKRSKIFSQNLLYIEDFNNRIDVLYKLKMNHLGHLSDEEYWSFLSVFNSTLAKNMKKSYFRNVVPSINIDYRTKGAVGEVKDQEECHCSWAFSAIGALEAQYFFKTKVNRSFSVQEVIDSSSKQGNQGCNGGIPEWAFNYVRDNGVSFDKDYPYTGKHSTCGTRSVIPVNITVTKINKVPNQSEYLLQNYLVSYGPVSVVIDASERSFRFYSSGIYHSQSCSSINVNHALLLVGMKNLFNGYYIIQNNWGTDWGIDGYIHLAKNKYNMCGIATLATVPEISIIKNGKKNIFKI